MNIPDAKPLYKASEKGDFTTAVVYTVDGQTGLYRLKSREGRNGPRVGKDCILVCVKQKRMGEIVDSWKEAVRWEDGERTLLNALGVNQKEEDTNEKMPF